MQMLTAISAISIHRNEAKSLAVRHRNLSVL